MYFPILWCITFCGKVKWNDLSTCKVKVKVKIFNQQSTAFTFMFSTIQRNILAVLSLRFPFHAHYVVHLPLSLLHAKVKLKYYAQVVGNRLVCLLWTFEICQTCNRSNIFLRRGTFIVVQKFNYEIALFISARVNILSFRGSSGSATTFTLLLLLFANLPAICISGFLSLRNNRIGSRYICIYIKYLHYFYLRNFQHFKHVLEMDKICCENVIAFLFFKLQPDVCFM